MDSICDNFNNMSNVTAPQLHPGNMAGACVIFLGILPLFLFNFRVLPLGSTGALLVGLFLMVASTLSDQTQVYIAMGNPGNLRAIIMALGIMIFAQYFQRENLLDYAVDRVLNRPLGPVAFLCRATALTFIGTGLLSQDATSTLLAPKILQIWQSRGRCVTGLETLLLGISTSANIASTLTIYASVPISVLSSKTSNDSYFKLDMPGCFTYLALPAVVGYVINLVILIMFSKVVTFYLPDQNDDGVIELEGVEDSLITPNAIIDNIVEEPLLHQPEILIPQVSMSHSYSSDCVRKKNKKPGGGGGGGEGGGEGGGGGGGGRGLHVEKNADFSHKLTRLSVGDIGDKTIHAQGPPAIFIHKDDAEEPEANKDQCHSLYNLDKIGYIAVSERYGRVNSEIPRTVSFYHSFSDLDSWQYTRDNIVKRFEHDHPKTFVRPTSPLLKRRMSSRGQLESVQFSTRFKLKLPRQRRTSVWYKGLMTDALRVSTKVGIYRAFSGASPSVSFMTGSAEDYAQFADIVSREFKPSNSRFFKVFLVVAFCSMFALYCVGIKHIHIDIGLLPMSAVAMVMVVDAGWNRRNCTWILRRLDWSVVVTYLSLFAFVHAFTSSNVPLWLWHRAGLFGNAFSDVKSIAVLLCLVVVLANTIGAVPLTLIVVDLLPECTARYPVVLYLAWGVAMSCNMTLHGTSCNMVITKKAEDIVHCELTYWGYMRYATLSSCLILAVGTAAIYGMIRTIS